MSGIPDEDRSQEHIALLRRAQEAGTGWQEYDATLSTLTLACRCGCVEETIVQTQDEIEQAKNRFCQQHHPHWAKKEETDA